MRFSFWIFVILFDLTQQCLNDNKKEFERDFRYRQRFLKFYIKCLITVLNQFNGLHGYLTKKVND